MRKKDYSAYMSKSTRGSDLSTFCLGAVNGSEETPGHVVPAAGNAEAGDKHARTEESKPSGSPKKGAKKAKTDTAEDTSLGSAMGGTLKPSSPKKGGAAVSKETEAPAEGAKATPSSPKKAAPSSPKKGSSSPKKAGIAEKVQAAVPAANKE